MLFQWVGAGIGKHMVLQGVGIAEMGEAYGASGGWSC